MASPEHPAACNHEFPAWDGMVVDTLPQQRFRRCSLCGRVEVSTSDDEGRTWSEWEEAHDGWDDRSPVAQSGRQNAIEEIE